MTYYNRDRFEAAHTRLRQAPLELTDVDLAQLAIIDPALEVKGREAQRQAQLAIVRQHQPVLETKQMPAPAPRAHALAKWFDSYTDAFLLPLLKDLFGKQKDRIATLEAEIAALKATAYLKDAGLWRHGATYALGDVAQFSGSAWVCTKAHTASGPTADHTCWRLWIKRGKDGKAAR